MFMWLINTMEKNIFFKNSIVNNFVTCQNNKNSHKYQCNFSQGKRNTEPIKSFKQQVTSAKATQARQTSSAYDSRQTCTDRTTPWNELSGKGHAEDRCPWSVRALWSRFAKPPLAVTRANRQKIGKKLPPAPNGGTPGLLGIKRHQILYRSACHDRVFCFEIVVLIFYDSWYKGSLHKNGYTILRNLQFLWFFV